MRILIIEDHEPSARALAKMLKERLGEHGGTLEAEFAACLDKGLEIAITFNADITILDPGLPDCTYEQAALAIPKFPPPVLIVTDYQDDNASSYELFCYQNGAANYLTKRQLRETIVAKQGQKLVEAITKAYWRSVLPTEEVRAIHAQALAERSCLTDTNCLR